MPLRTSIPFSAKRFMIVTTTGNRTERRGQIDVASFGVPSLQDPILRVLVYYDLFLYPLTSREIYLFIDTADVLPEEIDAGLEALCGQGMIGFHEGYWYLIERGPEVVLRRLQMEQEGKRMWKIARRVGSLMKMAPFVRGIFISGQLSRYIADEESDIDYFIVTEPERLWIVRTLFVLCRRTLFLNSRKYFCTNYYITSDHLTIRDRTIYTACETTALKPLWNSQMFADIVESNTWVSKFYPNFSFSDVEFRPGVRDRRSRLQALLERLIPARLAARLDNHLMKTTQEYWHRKFPHCPQQMYDTALRCTPSESRAHPEDQSVYVLNRYHTALALRGISLPEFPQTQPSIPAE